MEEFEHNVDTSEADEEGGGDCERWCCCGINAEFGTVSAGGVFGFELFVIIPTILRLDFNLSILFCKWALADSNSSILVNASRNFKTKERINFKN